jgi:hypothetical protein
MGQIIGIILIVAAFAALIKSIQYFATFWGKVWVNKEFDLSILARAIIGIIVFILIFFFIQGNPEFLNFEVVEANA